MPPAVQNRLPVQPSAPASKRATPAASDPASDPTTFRQELVRQRKHASKPRDAAQSNKALSKPARAHKSRKARPEPPQETRPSSDAPSIGHPPAPTDAAPPAELSEDATPQDTVDNAVKVEAPATEDSDALAAASATVPTAGPADPTAAESEASPDGARRTVPALVAAEVQLSDPGAGDAPTGEEVSASAESDLLRQLGVAADAESEESGETVPAETAAADDATKARPAHSGLGQSGVTPAIEATDDKGEHRGNEGQALGGDTSDPSWTRAFDASPAEQGGVSPEEQSAVTSSHPAHTGATDSSVPPALDLSPRHAAPASAHAGAVAAPEDTTPPEVRFAAANHDNIVKEMRADLLPGGGSMRIRLDPPHLGALQVTVQVVDGMVTAAFETSNDEATRLLGHSLNQLKAVLESHGVGVDKLQVQQAPRDERPATAHDDGSRRREQPAHEQEHAARQEQQRREMLRKMWRRLAGGADPLDVTV